MKCINLRITSIFISICVISGILASCVPAVESTFDIREITSYREIPGVTPEEIEAIEALGSTTSHFTYGTMPNTEAFLDINGEIGGFAALFCGLLTDLFEIPFTLKHYAWSELTEKLNNGEIDFVGNLSVTEERLKIYSMTAPIAYRTVKYMRLPDSMPISRIKETRLPRYAVLQGSAIVDTILSSPISAEFELVYITEYIQAYEMMKSGSIDALIATSSNESVFDAAGGVVTDSFLPLINSPVSLTAQKPELAAVISVMDKYISAGGDLYLHDLYDTGFEQYRRNLFYNSISERETEYLNSLSEKVPIVSRSDIYPLTFFNEIENEYQGLTIDILSEISSLTGISFDIINDKDTPFAELIEMLRSNQASLITVLNYTKEREKHFTWADSQFLTSSYVFLSKSDLPNTDLYQIEEARTGVIRGTIHEETYNLLFPDFIENLTLYETNNDAFTALENGEIDLLFTLDYVLKYQTNYREKNEYKINQTLPVVMDSFFGFNKNETMLCSIINKAMSSIDTERIANDWTSRVFDYSKILLREQWKTRIYAILAVSIFVLLIFTFIFYMYVQNKQKLRFAQQASQAKTTFLSNMSHELRTPMNSIIGIAQIKLQKEGLPGEYKTAFEKIYTSSNNLLDIINDILDLSKIEIEKTAESQAARKKLLERLQNFTVSENNRSAKDKIAYKLMPYGKVLVVDDVESNLYVAKGLLMPYELKIDMVDSGFAAIKKLEAGENYDVIFMDHMMPLMDGIEATQKIRGMGYKGAIIALTANALTGNREMFIKNGFDEFIPKPIELSLLNSTLKKFVCDRYPKEAEKYEMITAEAGEFQTADITPNLIEAFLRDAERAIITLKETDIEKNDIKLFTTTVHAMKSALANIGELEKSMFALELEKAGRSGDTNYIKAHIDEFLEALESLIDKLTPEETDDDDSDIQEDTGLLREQLEKIMTACEEYDDTAAYAALDLLKDKPWKKETSAAINKIRNFLFLDSDFEAAAEQTGTLLEKLV